MKLKCTICCTCVKNIHNDDDCGLYFTDVHGPYTVMYIALEEMVLYYVKSHGVQNYTCSNTKAKKVLHF